MTVVSPSEADAGAVLENVMTLRQEARFTEATELLINLGRASMGDADLVGQCFNLLHRCKGWSEAVSLYDEAIKRKSIRKNRIVQVQLADCYLNLGRIRLAKIAITGIAEGSLHENYDKVVRRVATAEVEVVDPKVVEIEDAFSAGEFLKGATLFRSFLNYHRSLSVVSNSGSVRDQERESFATKFSAEFGVPAPSRRLTIISDSIALPRPSIGVEVSHTYPWRLELGLREHRSDGLGVLPNCQRQRTAEGLVQVVKAAEQSKGFLFQVGIVDCAPRVFSEVDIEVVRQFKGAATANAMIDIAKSHRKHLLGGRNSVYVPIDRFKILLAEAIAIAKSKSDFVAVATIVTPSQKGVKMRNTPMADHIMEYNDGIKAVCESSGALLLDFDAHVWAKENARFCFTSDNYHYNALGHEYCSDLILARMIEIFP